MAVARAQATSFQQQLDNLTAKLMDKEEEDKEKEKERQEAQELEELERAEEKRHKEEMRQLERDKKSSCDQQRMKAMADAYVKQNGRVSTTEDYERNFLPYMLEFFDQETTPTDLVELNAELWTPVGETILHAKKRKELYFFLTNVIDKDVKEKLESTIRENKKNDVQAIWRKMSKSLKRGETEGEGNKCLEEMLKCTMQSSRKTLSGFGGEIIRYQNLMVELGMEQNEKKMLIPLYLSGMSTALKDVKTQTESKITEGPITLAEVMKYSEEQAKTKGLHNNYIVKHQNSQEVRGGKTKKEKAKEKKEKQEKEKQEKDKKMLEETESLKKQLSVAIAVAQQNYSKNAGPKECWHGTKPNCPRDDCKFSHKSSGNGGSNKDRADTWCAKCEKKTNHALYRGTRQMLVLWVDRAQKLQVSKQVWNSPSRQRRQNNSICWHLGSAASRNEWPNLGGVPRKSKGETPCPNPAR